MLDDDYTLYDDGTVLHEYDKNSYPGGQNLKATLKAENLPQLIKERLYKAASSDNKDLDREILKPGSE